MKNGRKERFRFSGKTPAAESTTPPAGGVETDDKRNTA
ncbi:hypothetical protein AKN40_3964 [Escherichia coli]|nr:hypothetical protein AKN40_3964 [Escherichia coli]EFZ56725.1 hypothetical protein ECLT68_4399 [Escherichia coli LT-68]EZJ79807.1 hypothetical protein AC56_0274 [Escherichia coli 1-182-04_S3_C3]EZJ90924.1 hypothetical protein AC27_0083 [Escherichia coli 1-182-04_S3_C2]EZK04124.1 hypothetical protein AB99_0291 [Escherichia coli 1-182-04_S3_C1]